ncbi:endoplasmic reticulum junction formation protein lunapark-A isoform X2 [Polypterus senegalus]|uniref:endoplasmic reticulum junction formation protein lunapark-A isoform X2 n=1 Tax=Polypterus senegalus TaxID=55291 RepID=UPI001962359D|nr:endoplasmic reticulum junction formation protein lunapark-A isoform X2 [Polypterus senegalus]
MGATLSKWRSKPSTVDVLEGIDKDIHNLEEFREKNQRLLKLWVGRLLLYSSLLYLLTCIVVYLWYFPEQWTGRLIMALPFFAFPVLVWFLRKLMIWLFSKRTERNNEKLEDLKSQKKKILEEVMEKETYKTAKLILERFDPDSKKKNELEQIPVTGAALTPRPGQDLRQRNISQRNPTASTPVPANPSHGVALSVVPGTPSGQMTTSAPGRHPPGPPLARPILPRERGAMDRVIEFLVGDGPQNRYALICQQCFSHNGMALKEEYEYIAFRCAYCFFLNPARKMRPQAPRLPDFSFEKKPLTDSQASAASPSDCLSENLQCTARKEKGNIPPCLQKGEASVPLATAPWSKVHSFTSNSADLQVKEETVTKTEETQPESDQEPEIPVLPCEEQQVEETLRLEDGQPSENEKEKDDDVSLMETE